MSCYSLANVSNSLLIIDLHFWVLQDVDSECFPLQKSPPYAGTGESQRRDRCLVPPPQSLEHLDQLNQDPQEPSLGPVSDQ